MDCNNIWINKGDKWKVAFTTLEGSFELTVIFFRLTNSLEIFQTIVNEILRDLINTGEVASFINNVIVGMEEKEEYDEVVEKVVKRLYKRRVHSG